MIKILLDFKAHFVFAAAIGLIVVACLTAISARADDLNQVQKILGVRGQVRDGALVVRYPRVDIAVSIEGDPVPAALGFVSTLAWKNMGDNSMVLGDLVLLEKEVNPVISALERSNINITALYNHFMSDKPQIKFLYIQAVGRGTELARGINAALDRTGTPQDSTSLPSSPLSLNTSAIERIMGYRGTADGSVFKITVVRTGVMSQGMELTSDMGMNSWAGFIGTDEHAHVAGAVAMTATEVNRVIRALRSGGIAVEAIHNHLLDEAPRMFFLYYWGTGPAKKLAETVRSAFEQAQGLVR
jgi:Domain of Unknown Function (DUF1259)